LIYGSGQSIVRALFAGAVRFDHTAELRVAER
jgi:hypothetical protein